MNMAFATLFNVVIYNPDNAKKIQRRQFYAGEMSGAIKQAEEFGKVIKITEAMFDDERHLY